MSSSLVVVVFLVLFDHCCLPCPFLWLLLSSMSSSFVIIVFFLFGCCCLPVLFGRSCRPCHLLSSLLSPFSLVVVVFLVLFDHCCLPCPFLWSLLSSMSSSLVVVVFQVLSGRWFPAALICAHKQGREVPLWSSKVRVEAILTAPRSSPSWCGG